MRFSPIILLIVWFISGCESDSNKIVMNLSAPTAETNHVNPTNTDTKPKDMIISYIPKSLDNPVFLETKDEAERISRQYGVKMEWMAPMNTQTAGQEKIMESLIRRKVDGIVVSCIDSDRLSPHIDRAIDAGIKVATFDSDCPNSKRLFYVGTNNYEIGKASAYRMLNTLEANGKMDKPLKALIMTGDKESLNLNERLRGFQDVLNAAVTVDYQAVLECMDDLTLAGELLETYIRTNDDIDLFFSTGGWPLLVPVDALPEYRKWREKGGLAVVVDTFYPMVLAAKEGMADHLIGQEFTMMGRWSMEHMVEAIRGKRMTQTEYFTNIEYADQSNFDKLLLIKEPWEIK
ncbi:substrate-binding domain-containing protein [Paenibacillus sp. GCM10012307]|uniref:Substrate-binding domain-containing protein n=1 Tax=Paenibacillus roseus TaxID=2798579 RepID=A0A934ML06_9BACL|nr:substrate-binding domain-containing protein [Paenibacillus roseus]MBJ6361645.1 substrate-binding domain-containing protein [Paenibacillus roseus]